MTDLSQEIHMNVIAIKQNTDLAHAIRCVKFFVRLLPVLGLAVLAGAPRAGAVTLPVTVGLQTSDCSSYTATLAGTTVSNSNSVYGCCVASLSPEVQMGETYTLYVDRSNGSYCNNYATNDGPPIIVGGSPCFDTYVNGVKTNLYYYVDVYKLHQTFSIQVVPKDIVFSWDFPKDGLQALPADGQSSVHGLCHAWPRSGDLGI